MAAQRMSLDERLERAARHLRFAREALAHLGGRQVWFVVAAEARMSLANPPIGQGTCIAGEDPSTYRISAEGLSQIIDESRAAVIQARRALGGKPPRGRGAAAKGART